MLRVPHNSLSQRLLCTLAVFLSLGISVLAQDLDTKLMEAARSRDTAAVQKLLKQGANANAKNKNGRTPLMEAASEGFTDTVRVLLANGAQVNARDNVGWTALFWAAFSRRIETLRVLVSKGANVDAKDGEGRTALFWASSSGHADVVRALLDRGAHVNARDNYGWTALMSAVDLGQIDTTKVLLEKGADVELRANDGSTALRLAEKYKYDNLVVLLRDATRVVTPAKPAGTKQSHPVTSANSTASGTKPDSTKGSGTSSTTTAQPVPGVVSKSDVLNQKLLQAAEAGDTSEVLGLIRDGAGVNARGATYGNTALMEAASRGHTDTVRTLLEKGGDVDATDNAGRTALMEAAFEGYTETARVLLDKGANINAHDKEGWTPLFWAAFSRRTETVRFLLEKGADVNAKNKYQDTALIHAAYGGDTDTVAVLLENHADINGKDDMGRTALIEAARQGHVDTVRILLQNGAAVGVQANDGSTALSMAEKLRYNEIANLLKNPPSKPPPKAAASNMPETPASENKTPVAGSTEPKTEPKAEPKTELATTANTPDAQPSPVQPAPDVSTPPRATPTPAKPPASDPLLAATTALEKKTRAQAFYRMGLSMRIVEDYWPQSGRVAERAAASILGDLTRVGAPDDLISLAQQVSTRLAVPPEARQGTISSMISDLRSRLNSYGLAQTTQQFFYLVGGFTYDMSLLGQQLAKPQQVEAQSEETRKLLLPSATSMAKQCAGFTECKMRALSYISDASNLLQQSPLQPADGKTLQHLCDQIGIALGTDEPLTAH